VAAVLLALRGLPRVVRERRPLPPHAEGRFLRPSMRSTSTARRYIS
jgi:N-acetylglucosaminyl-diphospho-decaprenol L-rhamnosyltransferase